MTRPGFLRAGFFVSSLRLRRAQRLQLLHKVGYIIRASAGKDSRKRNTQPCHVEVHAQRSVEVRANAKAQQHTQRNGSRLRGGGFPLLFKNRFCYGI